FLSVLSVCSGYVMAQNAEADNYYRVEVEEQYNPNSINPIPKYEHHFKKRVWRTVDLKEKQNKGFFSNNGEITRIIVDAVRSGEIADVYMYDSLTTKLSKEEFLGRLEARQGQNFEVWTPTRDWYT